MCIYRLNVPLKGVRVFRGLERKVIVIDIVMARRLLTRLSYENLVRNVCEIDLNVAPKDVRVIREATKKTGIARGISVVRDVDLLAAQIVRQTQNF